MKIITPCRQCAQPVTVTLPAVTDWREPQFIAPHDLDRTLAVAGRAGYAAWRLEPCNRPFGYSVTFRRKAASIAAAADVDGNDMRELVKAIVGNSQLKSVTFDELVELAEIGGLFERLTGGMNTEKGRVSSRASMARILHSYDRRPIGGCRFSLIGKGHKRRYQVERITTE